MSVQMPMYPAKHCGACIFLGRWDDSYDLYWCRAAQEPVVVFGTAENCVAVRDGSGFMGGSPMGEAFFRADVAGLVSHPTYIRLIEVMEDTERRYPAYTD
jgi:hypothetical protein